ncbi:MAG TPA: hypothetical protein VMS74_01675 [Acidimicrobiia bacterium]|nr:hypothetical protein [Acidimicrobiia bacterium]
MNHYYVEFHARDRIGQLHREADGSRRVSRSSRRRAGRMSGGARRRLVVSLGLCTVIFAGWLNAPPASAGGASTDRIDNVDSILAVAFPDNYPLGSIMRAECAFVQRVQMPDGSAMETLSCELSDEPVMIPELQGSAPKSALTYGGGACEWMSEYSFAKSGVTVFAESYRVVVTPAGKVHATSTYPADPLDCG